MAPFQVAGLSALEILDSRGRPTLAVTVRLADGRATGSSSRTSGSAFAGQKSASGSEAGMASM